jgi:hypothetical protein
MLEYWYLSQCSYIYFLTSWRHSSRTYPISEQAKRQLTWGGSLKNRTTRSDNLGLGNSSSAGESARKLDTPSLRTVYYVFSEIKIWERCLSGGEQPFVCMSKIFCGWGVIIPFWLNTNYCVILLIFSWYCGCYDLQHWSFKHTNY